MNFQKIRNPVFFVLLGAITVYFLYIVKPIFYPIFWAAIIASVVRPVYVKTVKYLKYKNLSAGIVLTMVILTVAIPLTLIGGLIVKQSIDLYNQLGSGSQIKTVIKTTTEWVKNNAITSKFNIDETVWVDKISQITSSVFNMVIGAAKSITENSLIFIVMAIITLYILFFFIRDGEIFLKKMLYLLPLGRKHEDLFVKKFTSAVKATLKGTLIIGLAQGSLGALMFYIAGIEGALLWGLLMMFFSMLNVCYVVWLPAGIIMLSLGNTWQGIFILAFGVLVISVIDNILRPILVSNEIKIHPLLIFVSTLGGLLIFGLAGIIIGPIITSLAIAFWEIYEGAYRKELEND